CKNGKFIPNAIEEDKIKILPTNNEYYRNGYLNLVYAGRLVDQKNPELILYATQDLIKQGYKIHSHIFGKGPKETYLKCLVKKLYLSDNISFHGFKENWLEFGKVADIFILPSRIEGMPNVLLESTVVGLPIVATNIPEIASIFTHKKDAWLVEVNSYKAIVEAIKILSDSEDIRDKLRKEASNIPKYFSIKKMLSSYEELYANILH
ncbi:MAG: glycosyltransferase, partial [Cyanobacteria bacterium P01_A01_bin.68]